MNFQHIIKQYASMTPKNRIELFYPKNHPMVCHSIPDGDINQKECVFALVLSIMWSVTSHHITYTLKSDMAFEMGHK